MIRTFTLVIVLAVFQNTIAQDDFQEAPAEPNDMECIFNGENLTGWAGDPRLWSVKEGVIHGETTPENPANGNTFLIYQGGKLKDFELRLSFRCTDANNSGIQYRSRHITEGRVRNEWVVRGYQHEIRNQNILPSVAGFIYDEGGKRGRMCLVGERATWSEDGKKTVAEERLIDDAAYESLFRLNAWNDVVIIAKGARLQHYLNGRLILNCTDNDPRGSKEGVLALQIHAGKPMWTEFKDVRIKHLK